MILHKEEGKFLIHSHHTRRLLEIPDLPERKIITKINPESISPSQGAILIDILKRKAVELNIHNKTDFWTPRKVDMVLWALIQKLENKIK